MKTLENWRNDNNYENIPNSLWKSCFTENLKLVIPENYSKIGKITKTAKICQILLKLLFCNKYKTIYTEKPVK